MNSSDQIEFNMPSPISKIETEVLDQSTSFADVTIADFHIPNVISDLSNVNVHTKVLPINAKNESSRKNNMLNYKHCTVFNGEFCIPDKVWRPIYDGNTLHAKYYPYYIRNRIAKFVNNN